MTKTRVRIGVTVAALYFLPFPFFLFRSASAIAQEPSPPTFRTGTTLVEFTVVALDGKGNPVVDLKKDDIQLIDRGKPKDIAFFRFDGDAPAADATAAPPDGFATNRPAPTRNVVAVVVDLMNVSAVVQAETREMMLKYLDSVPPNTFVSLYRFSDDDEVDTLQPFTTDVARLREKVKTLRPSVPRPMLTATGHVSRLEGSGDGAAAEARSISEVNSRLQFDRILHTLHTLEAVGNHLAGISGRKSLIWVGNSLPMRSGFDWYDQQIRASAQRLANAGVAVYPMMFGVGTGMASDRHSTMHLMADVTGGRAVYNTNDPMEGVGVAARDQRAAYTIGFYINDEADDQWRALDVNVRRPGVTLTHQQGYLSERVAQIQNWPATRWNDLAYDRLDSSAITLNGRAQVHDGQIQVDTQIVSDDLYFHEVDGNGVADLEVGLAEMTAKNEPTNVRVEPMEVSSNDPQKEVHGGIVPMTTTWPINPATTAVRVIVRDRYTGKYGTLDLPVKK